MIFRVVFCNGIRTERIYMRKILIEIDQKQYILEGDELNLFDNYLLKDLLHMVEEQIQTKQLLKDGEFCGCENPMIKTNTCVGCGLSLRPRR